MADTVTACCSSSRWLGRLLLQVDWAGAGLRGNLHRRDVLISVLVFRFGMKHDTADRRLLPHDQPPGHRGPTCMPRTSRRDPGRRASSACLRPIGTAAHGGVHHLHELPARSPASRAPSGKTPESGTSSPPGSATSAFAWRSSPRNAANASSPSSNGQLFVPDRADSSAAIIGDATVTQVLNEAYAATARSIVAATGERAVESGDRSARCSSTASASSTGDSLSSCGAAAQIRWRCRFDSAGVGVSCRALQRSGADRVRRGGTSLRRARRRRAGGR